MNGVVGGSGKKFYYHNDHLGSALSVTDENGNKVVERDFTPFGERINTDVYDDEPRDIEEDESGFTGKDWDEDVGLYYYNARWYDPAVGRFISEDSVSDPNNPNEFVYCANNPIINIDPTGNTLGNVIGALGKISQVMNLAAELNPSLKENSSFGNLLNNLNYTRNILSVMGQKNIEVYRNLDLVVIKDDEGNIKNAYKREDMKADFQKLAALQESKSSEAKNWETTVKDRYKDYFDTVKGDNTGVTVIGLRGWGIGGTKERPTLSDEARKQGEHDYDDMLLVLDSEGNLGAFYQINFEGSTLKGDVNIGGEKTTLDGTNPSILDGNFTLNTVKHGSTEYDALSLDNNASIPTGPGVNLNYPKRNPPYAEGVHIHKGGSDWTWSEGCITVFSKQWDRFINYFPKDQVEGTQVGKFSLMTL